MFTRIALAALLVTAGMPLAAAQSSAPAAPKPMPAPAMKSAPTAGQTNQTTSGAYKAPPAAREGEKGLPTGEGATSGDPVQVKRKP